MDSLDAQCLIVDLIEREMPSPDLWHHRRSGELSCAYAEGKQTFTSDVDAVTDLARRWRESGTEDAPERVRPFLDAHRRLAGMVAEQGLGPADAIVHDLDRRELRLRWEEEKIVVVIDQIPAD